jgi:hypothetical protein
MSEDTLRTELSSHVGGIFVSAASLIRKMDRPGMSIEMLRGSREAELFRGQLEGFSAWFFAAVAVTPDSVLTPEEKTFLHYWIAERDRQGEHHAGKPNE